MSLLIIVSVAGDVASVFLLFLSLSYPRYSLTYSNPLLDVLGKTPLSKKAHEKTHVHRAKFNGRPKLPGWLGKRWQAVAFIEGGE
jgi:hypothetical protein